MAEFNLIPERYVLWRQFVYDLRVFLIILLVFAFIATAGRVLLQRDIQKQSNRISELRKSKAYLDSQYAEIRDLLDSKSILETRFKLVTGLKGSLSAADLFFVMDESLSNEIEFESWSFQRVGQPVKQDQIDQGSAYFIIVDEAAENGAGYDGLRINAEMSLNGRARTHSAMAEFMRKLSGQRLVERVELVRSSSEKAGSKGDIEFELLVELITGDNRS